MLCVCTQSKCKVVLAPAFSVVEDCLAVPHHTSPQEVFAEPCSRSDARSFTPCKGAAVLLQRAAAHSLRPTRLRFICFLSISQNQPEKHLLERILQKCVSWQFRISKTF